MEGSSAKGHEDYHRAPIPEEVETAGIVQPTEKRTQEGSHQCKQLMRKSKKKKVDSCQDEDRIRDKYKLT